MASSPQVFKTKVPYDSAVEKLLGEVGLSLRVLDAASNLKSECQWHNIITGGKSQRAGFVEAGKGLFGRGLRSSQSESDDEEYIRLASEARESVAFCFPGGRVVARPCH